MAEVVGGFTIVKPLSSYLLRKDTGVKADVAYYLSDNLKISAWLYRPASGVPAGGKSTHPIDRPVRQGNGLVIGHGGIWGIPPHYDLVLRRLACAGWTIAVPAYRGEDGSEGQIEFARGEVDDLINCWIALTSIPEVDPERTWFLGSSHGAMLTMLALAREDLPEEISGGIAAYGVYDVEKWHDWMETNNHPLMKEPYFSKLFNESRESIRSRSAIHKASEIKGRVLLVHGEADGMVPVEQTLEMAKALLEIGRETEVYIEANADHEFIWGPDRPEALRTWAVIFDFINREEKGKKM